MKIPIFLLFLIGVFSALIGAGRYGSPVTLDVIPHAPPPPEISWDDFAVSGVESMAAPGYGIYVFQEHE